MRVLQVLGTGCAKCKKLTEETEAAAKASGIQYRLEKVTELQEIMKFHVIMTPALVVDGVVKAAGRIPSATEISAWLTEPADKPGGASSDATGGSHDATSHVRSR